MRALALLIALLLISLAARIVPAQESSETAREQSSFGGEEVPGVPFIKRTVSIPLAVLEILKRDDTVKGCLSDNEPTLDQPFSSWFVASSIHLDGIRERDLVVLPNPSWKPRYGCFYSASGIQWFWVFQLLVHIPICY